MLDFVPPHAWLLIGLAVVAFEPARYVYDHIAHSPRRRDITQPPEDTDWRSTDQLVRSLIVLGLAAAFAVFIFTPQAAEFAQSRFFLPTLFGGMGLFAIYSVINGFLKGSIEPLLRGLSSTYERASQPRRFWAALTWNALLGGGMIWLAFFMPSDWARDRCFNLEAVEQTSAKLDACNELVATAGSIEERADLLRQRGIAHHRLGDYQNALADYSQAILIDPQDSYALYNRALVRTRLGDWRGAVSDYDVSLQLRSDNTDAYLNRGLIFLDSGQFDKAIADFTRAHESAPDEPWALANRGIAYAWGGNRARARADFARVKAIDPGNPIVLHGEAVLDLQDGHLQSAIEHLTAALRNDPSDRWALRARADTYWKLGQHDKARDDDDRLAALDRR